jgi:hypothetical protein
VNVNVDVDVVVVVVVDTDVVLVVVVVTVVDVDVLVLVDAIRLTPPSPVSQLRLHFGQAIVEAENLDILEIRSTINTPSEAVAAVILLDQVTRDIYRGEQSVKVSRLRLLRSLPLLLAEEKEWCSPSLSPSLITTQVYRDFDPKALSLTKYYLNKPFDYGNRSLRESDRGPHHHHFCVGPLSLAFAPSPRPRDHETTSAGLVLRRRDDPDGLDTHFYKSCFLYMPRE